MKENITPAKSALMYGVIFGIIMILELVIMYTLDLDPMKYGWVGIVMNLCNFLILPVLFITLACNKFKGLNEGYITFGQCLKAGVSVAVIGAVIYALFSILFNVIFPEFQAEMVQKTTETMAKQNPNMSSEQLKQAVDVTKFFMKPYVAAPFTVVIYAFVGLLLSLIVGAVVKKDNPGSF